MRPQATQSRFFWSPSAPTDPSEIRRIERWLATARLFLAFSALVAIRMDPTELGYSLAAYGLLGFYMGNAFLIVMLLRRRRESTASFRLLVHAADIVWPAFISIFGEGPRSPFFLFFVFVLAAAAYRWGLWETLSTAAAEVTLLWSESFLLLHVWVRPDGTLPWRVFTGLRVNVLEFEPKRLFMQSIYLLVMGLLLGYLAEQQKHLRAEKAAVALLLGKARVEAGLPEPCNRFSVKCWPCTDQPNCASRPRRPAVIESSWESRAIPNRRPPNFYGWSPAPATRRVISTISPETCATPLAKRVRGRSSRWIAREIRWKQRIRSRSRD